ncbi:hypothetical protein A3860_25460 [Niastella vici]|uniref:Uncharacterized protein n=1 Tax=Niastella vici TaxID=1703345 RepID=A0A1V9FY42_9BACT|nr:hypothetical protein A3860_25460 [Niastella vici]
MGGRKPKSERSQGSSTTVIGSCITSWNLNLIHLPFFTLDKWKLIIVNSVSVLARKLVEHVFCEFALNEI